jgi:murein DD-endopeptidase MepM/ murein hydrolase activator NlpD
MARSPLPPRPLHPPSAAPDPRRAAPGRVSCVAPRLLALALTLAPLGACEIVSKDGRKQDTTTAAPQGAPPPRPSDSTARAGVPAVPSDSARAATLAPDSGVITLVPAAPRRGGVVFALAEGLGVELPHCSWKGAPLPCYRVPEGVLATVPLPADEPAGTYTLTFDRPTGRIARQVAVGERDFGRELIFLPESLYALIERSRDVARDARALRGILATETPNRLWSGVWRQPLSAGGRSTAYGVERFYYRASDSARAITLAPELHARGSFAADTSARPAGSVPSWRHAGIDMPAPRRTPVVAPAGGQVLDVGEYTLTGRTLVIDHGQGALTAYFHLDTILVHKGDVVRAGRTVARVGATGLATGPHLHYGVYVHGKDVDPAAWYAMPAFARGDTARVRSVTRR